jgi:hypothetical protein
VPHSGFGYPLCGLSLPGLGDLFQSPTLLGFALQSFSPSLGSSRPFERDLHSCAFLRNLTKDLVAALQRFCPPAKAEPPAPRRVNSGWDPLLSWAFPASQVFSVSKPMSPAFLRLTFPSRSFSSDHLKKISEAGTSRAYGLDPAEFPLSRGSYLPDLSHRCINQSL